MNYRCSQLTLYKWRNIYKKCAMYDNLHIWIDRGIVGESFSTIPNRLTDAYEVTNIETGETRISGNLDGLSLKINSGGLTVVGSLCKFLHGSNIYTLNRKSTKSAIEKLSEAIGADVSESKVTYLEFGTSFILSNPVGLYLKRLGYKNGMRRDQHGTLQYIPCRGDRDCSEESRKFVFYDKEKELRQKKETLPEGFDGLNILRYEIRFHRRLPFQLSCPKVDLQTLSDYWFYKSMIERYQKEYFSISRQHRLKPQAIKKISCPTDAFEVFVAQLISLTDKEYISNFLDDLRSCKRLTSSQRLRLRKKLERVSKQSDYLEKDELISELDDAIRNVSTYV